MNAEIVERKYIITYSNHFVFEGRTLAFRLKELFDITETPKLIKRSEQGWWVGKKLLSPSTAKELCKPIEIKKDVTHLQWYEQTRLDHVFHLT